MPSRFESRFRQLLSHRAALLLLAGGIIGFSIYVWGRDRAFHWAALDLSVNRNQAEQIAENFLKEQKVKTESYARSTAFWNRDLPVIYLEKSLGTAEANRILRSDKLPVWGWSTRFFRPLEKEEYRVILSPQGELLGFDHALLREKALPSLPPKQALKEANMAVRRYFAADMSSYYLDEQSHDQKPKRRDYMFRWQAKKSPVGSRSFLRVEISGNQISSVGRELEIPESFRRAEEEIQSRRQVLIRLVSHLDSALGLSMLVFLLLAWRRKWLRYRPALHLALFLFLLKILSILNGLPLMWYGYPTEDRPSAFWTSAIGFSFLFLVVYAAWQALAFVSSDAMGRLSERTRYSLGELTKSGFFHSDSFLTATIAGIGMAGLQLGFVVLFYIVGQRHLGFYSPLDVPYDDLLSTTIPWIQPLLMGVEPALREESTYRLFAIPLLLLGTKRKWLAVTLPALLWGFLHSGYYVEPIYARGLELSIVGIALGFTFLRFGIWSTLVAHYLYNTTISSSLFLTSSDPYLRYSSMIVIGAILIPVGAYLIRLWQPRRQRDLAFQPLRWQKSLRPSDATEERRRAVPEPILNLRLPAAVAGLAILGSLLIPMPWNIPSLSLEREQAIRVAQTELERVGQPNDHPFVTASLELSRPSTNAQRYVRRELAGTDARNYFDTYEPEEPYWSVHFGRPETADECAMAVGHQARILSFHCRTDEEKPGKTMAPKKARELVEKFLERQNLAPSQLIFVGEREETLPHRKDVTYRWTDPQANLGDLRRYVSATVSDGHVASFSTYLQPPEAFLRDQRTETFGEVLRNILWISALLAVAAIFVRALFDHGVVAHLRSPLVMTLTVGSTILWLLNWLNALPLFWLGYQSSVKPAVFVAQELLSLTGSLAAVAVLTFFTTLLFIRVTPQIFSRAPTAEDLRIFVRAAPWRWRGGRGAFMWALAVVGIQVFASRLVGFVSGENLIDSFGTTYGAFSAAVPAASVALDHLPRFLLSMALFASGVAACRKYAPKALAWAFGVLLVLAITFLSEIGDPWATTETAITSLALWVVALRVVKFHLPFYFWYGLLSGALPFFPWLFSDGRAFREQGMVVFAALAALAGALFSHYRRARPAP